MESQTGSLAVDPPAPHTLRWHQRRLLDQLARLDCGRLQVTMAPDRRFDLQGGLPGPHADMRIDRPMALLRRLAWRGDLGLAEAYVAGDWSSSAPARLLELFAVNLEAYADSESRHWLVRLLAGIRHRLNRNTRRGSRRNIAAHYDLGNDFYAQWLDPGMTYSAALFDGTDSLAEAQARKYERMLSLIGARPGEHVLEIGCGWGGFAEYAAARGVRVTGLTLSAQQLAHAQQRIARAGLSGLVDLRLCDYRDFDGTVDHVVSIEMFEAVGRDYWTAYFDALTRCLRPGGRVAMQVITIDESRFAAYAANPGGFIQAYIFPGGMLPTRTHLRALGGQAGLCCTGMTGFGHDYAETLAHWSAAFNGRSDWLQRHGYDERFRRLWRYYLAFCEAGFRAGHIDVVQCAFRRE